MTREEFKKQRCEIDKITEEEFEKQYRVVKCNCGQPYCKGYRCLDLDGLLRDNQELKEKLDKYENPEDMTLMMMWCTEKVKDENEKLKQQLHEASLTIQEMAEQDIECPSNCEKLRQLKKQLEELKSTNKVLSEELTKDKILKQDCLTTCCGIPIGDIPKLINQQKEFIEYMNKTIEELECDDVDDEEMKGYLIQRIDTFKEILQKYKDIIGDDK